MPGFRQPPVAMCVDTIPELEKRAIFRSRKIYLSDELFNEYDIILFLVFINISLPKRAKASSKFWDQCKHEFTL